MTSRICMILALFACLWATPSAAQNSALQSVTQADFGVIVAAPSGTSTFRADPATGSVTKIGGNGVRLGTAATRSLVTVYCGGQPACANADTLITVTGIGTPTGRAGSLQNFTVSTAGTTTTVSSTLGTGNTLTFTIEAFGRKEATSFWIGFDLPIKGNDSTGATGAATAGFVVTTARVNSGTITSTMASTATASVFRPLAIANTANLAFGRISRPTVGNGTVSLSPTTGLVTVTGTGTAKLGTQTAPATFAVTGEGGQSVSVSVPATFTMTGTSGSLVVTTQPSVSGAQVLSGTTGGTGTLGVKVGGSFPISATTPAQPYTGTFAVTVQYN